MSPLPSSASMLYNFFIFMLLCCPLSPHAHHYLYVYIFCYFLCYVIYLHSMRCTSFVPFISYSQPHSTRMHNYENPSLLFVLHIFIMPIPLPNNACNSLSSLAVILSLFFICVSYPEILWVL
jgi:hypothetical protein